MNLGPKFKEQEAKRRAEFNKKWATMSPEDKKKYQETLKKASREPDVSRMSKKQFNKHDRRYEQKEETKVENIQESELAGWIAFYNRNKLEIKKGSGKGEADSLYGAKLVAIDHFKVPKSKQSLIAIKPAYYEDFDPDADVISESKIAPFDAREFLNKIDARGKSFFALNNSQVNDLLDFAKKVKYRKSKNAPGSEARMFHNYLDRLADRADKLDSKFKKESVEIEEAKNPKATANHPSEVNNGEEYEVRSDAEQDWVDNHDVEFTDRPDKDKQKVDTKKAAEPKVTKESVELTPLMQAVLNHMKTTPYGK